jgi:adenylate cyclase
MTPETIGASPSAPGATPDVPAARGWRERLDRVSIAWKWSLAIAAITVIGMSALGAVVIRYQEEVFGEQIERLGTTVALQLAESAQEPLLAEDRLLLGLLASNVVRLEGILGSVILAADGTVVAQEGVDPLPSLPAAETQTGALLGDTPAAHRWQLQIDNDGQPVTLVSAPMVFNGLLAGHVLLVFDHLLERQAQQRSLWVIIATTMMMVGFAAVASIYLGRRIVQPIQLLTDASRAFGEGQLNYRIQEQRQDEIGDLITTLNQMADGLLEKRQVEAALSRYVSDSVAREILREIGSIDLDGRHASGSVVFADISGFSQLSEGLEPRQVGDLLNYYLGIVDRAAKFYRGTTDKFIGDCAMLVFGIPEEDPEHVLNALGCATLVRSCVERMLAERVSQGEEVAEFHIGVNAGEMLAGNLGSLERMQFTVVGDTVNIAERLCSIAARGEIVVSDAVARAAGVAELFELEAMEQIKLRGRRKPMTVFRVTGVREPLASRQQEEVARLLDPESET